MGSPRAGGSRPSPWRSPCRAQPSMSWWPCLRPMLPFLRSWVPGEVLANLAILPARAERAAEGEDAQGVGEKSDAPAERGPDPPDLDRSSEVVEGGEAGVHEQVHEQVDIEAAHFAGVAARFAVAGVLGDVLHGGGSPRR